MTEEKKRSTTRNDDFELGLRRGWVKYYPYLLGAVVMFYFLFPGIFR